jgi:putative ABC transport system ATP-binding protein
MADSVTGLAASGSRSELLSLRDVSYSYPTPTGRKQVLRSVSADVWPGEIVLMVGPSGAGKTTMLTLAGALRSVESGSILVLRQELSGAGPRERMQVRKKIGFIFQHHNLLESLSAVDNVQMALAPLGYPAKQARKECVEMLQAVGMGKHIHSRPRNLSGGQQQRVAIARALVRKPQLVLADEPTASLDGVSGREIVELLRRLARMQGCAIMIVTHDSRILDLADRSLRLEDGVLLSNAATVTQDSAHTLTMLTAFGDSEAFDWYWGQMETGAFLETLRRLRVEATQYLNVMDFGDVSANSDWMEVFLGSVLSKAAALVDAAYASVRTTGESGLPAFFLQAGAEGAAGEPARLEVLGRDSTAIGVAEFRAAGAGSILSESSVRRLKDFEKPLGVLLEMTIRSREQSPS